MRLHKRKIIIITLILAIILSFTLFLVGFINFLSPKLSSFSIVEVTEKNDGLYLVLSKSHNAITYHLTGYDEENNIIYETDSNSNEILLENLSLKYNDKIRFIAYAYNKNNKSLISTNEYIYNSLDLSFNSNNNQYTTADKNILFTFDGDPESASYSISVYYEDALLKNIPITENSITIDKEVFTNIVGKVNLKLIKNDNRVVDTFNLYVNTPIVGNISIKNLNDDDVIAWDDLELKYDGGINATSLSVYLYNDGTLENSYKSEYKEGSITLPASFFKEETSYTLKIVAMYKDYAEVSKSDEVNISVAKKETVNPVYVNYNFKNIKKGSLVTLTSNTKDATIYYTTDGTEPNLSSNIYKVPIIINEDVTIKTKAIRKNMYDSDINTYNFHVGEKQLVVYLSPSNQYANYGASDSGFTNEKAMMNKITDVLKSYLEENGVKVYRNNPSTDINTWLSESNYVKSDLHLAIHSNGSTSHNAYGMEMYVDKSTSKSLSIANKIYNNLYSIYPYKDSTSNRGIKYSEESLGEANDSFISCGTLIEIAYHDNYRDASWIASNIDAIAKNIGDSILEYYQVN